MHFLIYLFVIDHAKQLKSMKSPTIDSCGLTTGPIEALIYTKSIILSKVHLQCRTTPHGHPYPLKVTKRSLFITKPEQRQTGSTIIQLEGVLNRGDRRFLITILFRFTACNREPQRDPSIIVGTVNLKFDMTEPGIELTTFSVSSASQSS